MDIKQIVLEVLQLLGIALVTAFSVNYLSPNGIALWGEWDVQRGVVTAKSKQDAVNRKLEIRDPVTAKQLFDTQDILFVDARNADEYNEGHIKGAVSFPVYHFDDMIDSFLDTYGVSTPIITYCSGRECDDSHRLAQLLADMGYSGVRVFIDGFPVWKERGYPVEP